MATRNAFEIVPFGLYRHRVGGDRRVGRFWYRWFMEANPNWYVGINANLASTGVGLAKAARLLEGLSYRATLARGFAVVRGDDGSVLTRAAAVPRGGALRIGFADGEVPAVAGGGAPAPKRARTGEGGQGSLF